MYPKFKLDAIQYFCHRGFMCFQQMWDFVFNNKLFVSQLCKWYSMIKKMITIDVGSPDSGAKMPVLLELFALPNYNISYASICECFIDWLHRISRWIKIFFFLTLNIWTAVIPPLIKGFPFNYFHFFWWKKSSFFNYSEEKKTCIARRVMVVVLSYDIWKDEFIWIAYPMYLFILITDTTKNVYICCWW